MANTPPPAGQQPPVHKASSRAAFLGRFQRASLGADVLAGLTLAVVAIPECMGYTKIAGTSVVTGLYTILLPLLAFALLGSSRHLVVGADSATAAILFSGLQDLAQPFSAQWLALSGASALLTAGFLPSGQRLAAGVSGELSFAHGAGGFLEQGGCFAPVRTASRPAGSVAARSRPDCTFLRNHLETAPGLIVYRFEAALFFANADYFAARLHRLIAQAPHPVRWLVLDLVSMDDIDYTGGLTLAATLQTLRGQGLTIALAQTEDVADELARFGIVTAIGGRSGVRLRLRGDERFPPGWPYGSGDLNRRRCGAEGRRSAINPTVAERQERSSPCGGSTWPGLDGGVASVTIPAGKIGLQITRAPACLR